MKSEFVDGVWEGFAEQGQYELPLKLIDVKKYVNPETERFMYVSSYGCVGQCTFCATKERKKVIFRDMAVVRVDIANLMERYPFKECVFFDATLFTKPDRAAEIADIMRSYGLKWIADARADEIVRMEGANPVMLDYIMNSGIKRVTIGLETGSERVAQMMKKGANHLQKFKECAKIMKRYPNVQMCSGVIFGCPGETPEDIRETIRYIDEIIAINPAFRLSTTFFRPLPNTEMADMAKEYGYSEPDSLEGWAEFGAKSHYGYNQWMDTPWIEQKDEYKRIYEEFHESHKSIMV